MTPLSSHIRSTVGTLRLLPTLKPLAVNWSRFSRTRAAIICQSSTASPLSGRAKLAISNKEAPAETVTTRSSTAVKEKRVILGSSTLTSAGYWGSKHSITTFEVVLIFLFAESLEVWLDATLVVVVRLTTAVWLGSNWVFVCETLRGRGAETRVCTRVLGAFMEVLSAVGRITPPGPRISIPASGAA